MDEILNYSVSSIKLDGAVTIDYTVTKLNGMQKKFRVTSYEKPHEDFRNALMEIKECFNQMIGFPLVNQTTGEKLKVYIKKITFMAKPSNGRGMKLQAVIHGIENHYDETIATTLPFFEIGLGKTTVMTKDGEKEIHFQQLTANQFAAMEKMSREAFAFVYYNKKEQPTLEEAAELVAEQGGLIND